MIFFLIFKQIFARNRVEYISVILATMCLGLPEQQVLKSCALFLTNFISQSRETSLVSVVQNCGEQLVFRILLNLGKNYCYNNL